MKKKKEIKINNGSKLVFFGFGRIMAIFFHGKKWPKKLAWIHSWMWKVDLIQPNQWQTNKQTEKVSFIHSFIEIQLINEFNYWNFQINFHSNKMNENYINNSIRLSSSLSKMNHFVLVQLVILSIALDFFCSGIFQSQS